jgi:membrane protease YdiL (CAAX protease family)
MKKCPYCGKEYKDDVERCIIDHEILVSEEGKVDVSPVEVRESVCAVTSVTERQIRIFEVVLVCLIAFGGGFLTSTYSLLNEGYGSSGHSAFSWMLQSFREISALGLVWYVLLRQKKSFSDLGLAWAKKDIGWSILLRIAGSLVFFAVYNSIYYFGLAASSQQATSARVGHDLFGGGIFFTTILFQFINPFFEELIVRAYLMTEIKALTGSVNKAILASTLIQMSYHFYQGAPAAFGHGATFLIFSIYYAKTNRIAPIILAHLYSDVGNTLLYWAKYQ